MPRHAGADTVIRDTPLPREFPGALWYDQEEIDAAARVIRARSPFRFYGTDHRKEVEWLEREFADAVNAKHALAVGSGTAALRTAMTACRIGPGQEVLLPAYFWISTVAAVVHAGAVPVLVEIDDTFNMDPADLEEKITPNSAAVLCVHMSGAPADMDPIVRIARKHDLKVIEDCAQANGASVAGKSVGTFGDIGTFSFQVNKNITAGEGGMIVTDDDALLARCNAAHDIGVPWIDGVPDDRDPSALWGVGSRMGELAAAVLRVQLRKLDAITTAMRDTKRRIVDAIADIPELVPARRIDPAGDSGPFLIVQLPTRRHAHDLTAAMNARGLAAIHLERYHLHVYFNVRALVETKSNSPDGFPWTHPANRPLVRDYARGACPRSDDLLERAVMISIPSRRTDQDVVDIIAIYHDAARSAGLQV